MFEIYFKLQKFGSSISQIHPIWLAINR